MPLADLTAVSTLALDYIGEPYLTAYATDTTVAAQACRLHLPQCIETVLEGHVWSFATRCSQLTEAAVESTTAQINIYPGGENNGILLVAQTPGPSGNEISLTLVPGGATVSTMSVEVLGNAITVTFAVVPSSVTNTADLFISGSPLLVGEMLLDGFFNGKPFYRQAAAEELSYDLGWDGAQWVLNVSHPSAGWTSSDDVDSPDLITTWVAQSPGTGSPDFAATIENKASEVIDAITADNAASLLVTAVNAQGHDGTGVVSAVEATYLEGGSSTSTVYAPAYGTGFNLPSDCLRFLKIDTEDIDAPRNDFEIQGRYLLLQEELAEAPVIHYITSDPPVDEWPTTFTDAVAFLLASRLAPKLAQDQALAADMLQKHEMALGKARSKDTRETRSKENFGPRHLAARSGLVRSRFASHGSPWTPTTGVSIVGETASVDLDGLFTENL